MALFGDDDNTGGVHDDGSWAEAAPVSLPLLEYPFQSRGDAETFLVRQKFQQEAKSFQALKRGTIHPTYPQALLVEESPHRDLGGGKIEWERLWATLPKERKEPEGYVYEYQIVLSDGTLQPLQLPVGSTVTYTYFRVSATTPPALSTAPKLIKVGAYIYKLGAGDLHLSTGFVVSSDPMILAANDTYEDWKGDIRCRKRREIPGPTTAFWGTLFPH